MRNGGGGLPGLAATLMCCMSLALSGTAIAQQADPLLANWERTDKPVMDGAVSRTWMWGPQASAYVTMEQYAEAPGGERKVIYFDKARMEITDPDRDRDDPWHVTNGLLVVELVTGRLQVGHNEFQERDPAWVNVAGDADDPNGVTYGSLAGRLAPHEGPAPETLTWTIDRWGNVGVDARLARHDAGVAWFAPETGHWVAEPFWEFMHATGPVWEDGTLVTERLFASPFYATGLPITEAYWTTALLAGKPTEVLLQCFERRCLTWTPSNPAGWQVEAGNVGLHYYIWRYGEPPPKPVG